MRKRQNNFLAFRFFFATLVMLSHAPEIIDGDRHREILTWIFGTISFGNLGVNGFFMISGFLITQSWENTDSLPGFLQKRLARIAPAYIVAYLLCVFAGVFVAANPPNYFKQLFSAHDLIINFKSITSFGMPFTPQVFAGQHYPTVNASMWTLQYEFECYLLLALLGNIGLLRKAVLQPAAIILIIAGWLRGFDNQLPLEHFALFFCTGSLFYLYRDMIFSKLPSTPLLGSFAATLFGLLFFRATASPALAIFGGTLLFTAIFTESDRFGWINKLPDFSYGLYLYGFPAEHFLIWYFPAASPWLIFIEAWPIAALLGLASWFVVEKPCLGFFRSKEKPQPSHQQPGPYKPLMD